MAYDAGSIEASLTVDRTPFQEGLAQADREAAEFSRKRYAAVIDLDTARADRKARDTRDELDRLGEKTARPKVDIDTARPLAELGLIKAAIEDINHKSVGVGGGSGGRSLDSSGGGFGGIGGPSTLVTAGVALAPALVPVVATLTAGVGALASAFTAAGVGAGGFALLAKPQLEQVAKAQQQLTTAQQQYDKATTNAGRATALRNEYLIYAQLTPQQRTYMDQLTGLKSVYKDLQAAVSPQVFTVAASVIHALGAAGELLKPVFQAAGDTFVELGRQFDSWVTKSAGLRQFVDFLTRTTGPAIYSFAHDLANIARGFGGILMAFEPLLGTVEGGLTRFTAKFAAWGAGLGSSAGFQKFLDYVRQNGPLVGQMLAELGRAFGTIITQLAPFGPIGLQLITDLAKLINQHPELVKVAAALVLVWKGVSLLSGAAGGIAGVADGFDRFGKLFKEGGALAGAGRIFGNLKTAIMGVIPEAVSLDVALGPVAGVAAAIIAVGVAIYEMYTHWQQIWQFMGDHKAYAAVAAGILFALAPLTTIAVIIAEVATHWHSVWKDISRWTQEAWMMIDASTGGSLTKITNAITTGVHVIEAVWNTGWNTLHSVVSTVFGGVKTVVGTGMSGIQTGISAAMHGIETVWNQSWAVVKAVITPVWNFIKTIVDIEMRATRTGLTNELHIVQSVWSTVWNTITSVAGFVWGMITSIVSTGISTVVADVRGVTAVVGIITGAFQSAYNGVAGAVLEILATAKSLPGSIVSAIGDVSGLLSGIGSAIIGSLWDGMKSAWGSVAGWVGGLAGTIKGLKGPLEYDRVMLHPEGNAIMQGLVAGMKSGMPSLLRQIGHINGVLGNLNGGGIGTLDTGSRFASSSSGTGGKSVVQNFSYAGPLTPQVVSEARRQLDFALGS